MKKAFHHLYMFFYFHFWLCIEVLQHIVYRGHFYIVTSVDPELKVTIRPMLHESFVKEKTEQIQSLSKKLPQEEFVAKALQEALYTFRYLIFMVPGKENEYVQFLFTYKKPGSWFMLEINSLNTYEDRGRIEKVIKLLQNVHYYPHTQDNATLLTYEHDFAGFYHHEMEGEVECIHILYKKSQIKEAAHMTSILLQKIFKYKGKVDVTVGDALDEYRHND